MSTYYTRWIPVTDSLPGVGTTVGLLQLGAPKNGVRLASYSVGWMDPESGWVAVKGDGFTHWCELPDLPDDESDGDKN